MKRIYLVLFLSFIGMQLSQSQVYHPLVDTGKLWSTYHFDLFGGPPYTDFTKFQGDTTLGLYTYKKVWVDETGWGPWSLFGSIREDAMKKVYLVYSYTTIERLLYDFNVTVGDSIYLMDGVHPYVLDSTGTFTLNTGELRKSYMFHSTIPGYPCTETWVEGIGSLTFGVLHSGFCGMVGDQPNMLCTWENDTLKYHWDYPECFIYTGIDNHSEDEPGISLYPNPASDRITIKVNNIQKELNVTVSSMKGEKLLQQTFMNQAEVQMDLNTLAKGIYLVKIQTRQGVEIKKLIID